MVVPVRRRPSLLCGYGRLLPSASAFSNALSGLTPSPAALKSMLTVLMCALQDSVSVAVTLLTGRAAMNEVIPETASTKLTMIANRLQIT